MPSLTIHTQKQRARWLPPPQDFFKINYDGAVFPDENRSGVGVMIRNNLGLVIASLVQQLPQAYQAVEVEAMAACRAMEFGREIGVAKVIVEGDSATVVKALSANDKGLAYYRMILCFSLTSFQI